MRRQAAKRIIAREYVVIARCSRVSPGSRCTRIRTGAGSAGRLRTATRGGARQECQHDVRRPLGPHDCYRENTAPCGITFPTYSRGQFVPVRRIPGSVLPGSWKRGSSDGRPYSTNDDAYATFTIAEGAGARTALEKSTCGERTRPWEHRRIGCQSIRSTTEVVNRYLGVTCVPNSLIPPSSSTLCRPYRSPASRESGI